ncbi:YihY/virulence factor BrkB family protein [Methylosoma difficile]
MHKPIFKFFQDDIWLLQEQKLPAPHAFFIKCLKIALLSLQGFVGDLCVLRASALTLYSILAIVPVIAMLFGIAKGFGYEIILQEQLLGHVPAQEKTILQIISFAQNLLESTKGEVIAGIGVVVLFWIIISLIGNIEESFNAIWKIDSNRPMSRKFSDYLSLMLLAPVLLIASSSMTVFLNTKITWLINVIHLPAFGTAIVLKLLSFTPLLLMTGLFAFTFIFMPNHRVSYRAGIIAGIVTGFLYDLTQWAYFALQIGVSSYNAIYGSFAALPLFVVWLQTGWMIVLFGCQVSFFLQNYPIYRNNNRFADLSFALKKVIALQTLHLIIKQFIAQAKPLTAAEMASRLLIPIAAIHSVLAVLQACHIILGFKNANGPDEVYQPAVDVNILSVVYVVKALEYHGQNQLPEIKEEPLFFNKLNNMMGMIEQSGDNVLLKDI